MQYLLDIHIPVIFYYGTVIWRQALTYREDPTKGDLSNFCLFTKIILPRETCPISAYLPKPVYIQLYISERIHGGYLWQKSSRNPASSVLAPLLVTPKSGPNKLHEMVAFATTTRATEKMCSWFLDEKLTAVMPWTVGTARWRIMTSISLVSRPTQATSLKLFGKEVGNWEGVRGGSLSTGRK